MSVIYRRVVQEYIEGLPKKTKYQYRSRLRVIYRALYNVDPASDEALYMEAWHRHTQTEIELALAKNGRTSPAPFLIPWRNIIKLLKSKGLQTWYEADRMRADKRFGDGSHLTTQAIPLSVLLPQEASSSPYTDTSRHPAPDERVVVDNIMRFTQDQLIKTDSSRMNEFQERGAPRGYIQFTEPDEARLDNQETISDFTKGHESSMFLKTIHAWLNKAPTGSSGPFAKSINTSTKVIHTWHQKFSS